MASPPQPAGDLPPGRISCEALARRHAQLAAMGPVMNHMPRVAALLLLGDGNLPAFADGSGCALLQHALQATTLSAVYTDPAAAAAARAPDFRAAGCWPARFSTNDVHVTLPAVAGPAVPTSAAALARLGRAVTFTEPCTIWEAPPAVWDAAVAGGWADDVTRPLDFAALSAACGLPDGLVFDALTPDDAPVLNAHWKYAAGASTEAVIRASIARYPSAGIRRRLPDRSELVAWVVMRYDGSFGILATLPEHRGKGLARAVMRLAMVQLRRWLPTLAGAPPSECDPALPRLPASLAVADPALRKALTAYVVPHCHIADYNTPSAALFKALGWACVGACTWLVANRAVPRLVGAPLTLPATETAVHPGDVPSADELAARAAAEPWLADEPPGAVAASPAPLLDLLSLVNRSYKQDDAFFVDQWRAGLGDLRHFAAQGAFYLFYRVVPTGADEGGDDAAAAAAEHRDFGLVLPPAVSLPPSSTISSDGGARVAPAVTLPQLPPGWALAPPPEGLHAATRPQPVAAVHISVHNDDDSAGGGGRTAHLSLLTVDPALKRTGVSSRLLAWALDSAAAGGGATAAQVHVVSVKPWLLEYYRRAGFAVVGSERWPAHLEHQLLLPTHFHVCRKPLGAAAPAVAGAAAAAAAAT